MKLETTNDKKQYVQPKIKVCMIDACDIIAQSPGSTQNGPADDDDIYLNLRD